MTYVVAYDIGDAKRLARVARVMERSADRCQKSVFLFDGAAGDVRRLLATLRPLVREADDIVQAWRLAPGQPSEGIVCGSPKLVRPPFVILGESDPGGGKRS